MAKRPTNNGASWSAGELRTLKQLAKAGTAQAAAKQLGRTPAAVQQKAMRTGISFRAAPCGTRTSCQEEVSPAREHARVVGCGRPVNGLHALRPLRTAGFPLARCNMSPAPPAAAGARAETSARCPRMRRSRPKTAPQYARWSGGGGTY